jgi:hypothetical protein
MMRWRIRPRRAAAPVWGLVLGVLAIMAACEGKTLLEGELLDPPPDLFVDRTATPAQVHAGTAVRLRARAEGRTSAVAAIHVSWTGAMTGAFTRSYPGGTMAAVLDTTVAVPRGVAGQLVFTATAVSTTGVESPPLDLVVQVLGEDTEPPQVSVASAIPDRVEAEDSLSVTIRCRDLGEAGQLAWCGYTVLFFPTGGDTITVTRRDTVPARDTASIRDVMPILGFNPATLPTELNIEVHGFAVDAAGNCSAGVLEAWSRASCVGLAAIRADVEEEPTVVTVVASTTIHRHWGGSIEELAVDSARALVYASVIDRNRIEVLSFLGPREQARRPDILVGSRPAGIVLDINGQALIVANSGGTSLSRVDLNSRQESSRLETANASLYSLTRGCGGGAPVSFWRDYGDRPLRVAQDRDGKIMYSTTSGGPIRMMKSWQAQEPNIMLWSDVVVDAGSVPNRPDSLVQTWAVTRVDSITIKPESIYECNAARDTVIIHDRVPGSSQQITGRSTVANMHLAIAQVRSRGSDILAFRDSAWATEYWDVGREARFATSRDRSTIAIADGSRAWTWIATGNSDEFRNRLISWYLSIDDLSNNMELGIAGLAVDGRGKQFAARGGSSVIYFDDLLRLHGSHEEELLGGDGGVVLHPTERLAFAPTNDRSVLVLQTGGHYQRVAELPLVENLVGSLHFSSRRDGDPPNLVGRIHGVNESGNVVTLPVRSADIQ